jgi:hypothetical protein
MTKSSDLEEAMEKVRIMCLDAEKNFQGEPALLDVAKTCWAILEQTKKHKEELRRMSFQKTGDVEIQKIFCSCGEEIPQDTKKCPKCGKELVKEEPK